MLADSETPAYPKLNCDVQAIAQMKAGMAKHRNSSAVQKSDPHIKSGSAVLLDQAYSVSEHLSHQSRQQDYLGHRVPCELWQSPEALQ